jgi:hypothetical protein
VFMTRVSCNSLRLLLLAFIPLCASVGVARADIDQTFNFSGVLTQPVGGNVTGQFTIDFTTGSVAAFDFSTPKGAISPGSASITEFQGVNPDVTFTALGFSSSSNGLALGLLFESPLSAFSASSFYTDPVTVSDGVSVSAFVCLDEATCSGVPASIFSSGSVTPAPSAVPEPRSALLLIGVLLFTACVIRRKAKPLGSH